MGRCKNRFIIKELAWINMEADKKSLHSAKLESQVSK